MCGLSANRSIADEATADGGASSSLWNPRTSEDGRSVTRHLEGLDVLTVPSPRAFSMPSVSWTGGLTVMGEQIVLEL